MHNYITSLVSDLTIEESSKNYLKKCSCDSEILSHHQIFWYENFVSIVKIKSENFMNFQINLFAVRAEFKIVRFICDNSSNVRDYMKGRKKERESVWTQRNHSACRMEILFPCLDSIDAPSPNRRRYFYRCTSICAHLLRITCLLV